MIYIAGGSGFIGSRLAGRLEKSGRQFRIIDRRESSLYPALTLKADVRDLAALEKALSSGSSSDAALINLAAEHRDNVQPESLYDEVNVGGAENICAAARSRGINFQIFTSSVAVYGFAPPGTDETGEINYFNSYGRTKYLAENVYRRWQEEDPRNRTLVIIRPTVVFGENNRGNVYNLINQVASGRFLMVGNGKNRKSMAYVENAAAFIEHSLSFSPGIHLYNYIDKPDFDMNTLVETAQKLLGGRNRPGREGASRSLSGTIRRRIRLPYAAGLAAGYVFDLLAGIFSRDFPVSSIRVKKFCSETQFETSAGETGFIPPVPVKEAFEKTIHHDFIEKPSGAALFYSE